MINSQIFRFSCSITTLLVSLSPLAFAGVVIKSVGEVGGEVVSSRAVQISTCLEQALFQKGPVTAPDVNAGSFKKDVSGYLLELTVFKESQNFPVANVAQAEIDKAIKESSVRLSGSASCKALELSPQEQRLFIERKLRSKRFIRFKADSSAVEVTNSEAKDYFEKNRIKFGDLPFENFRENIKAYLTREQVEDRLRDWFEVLQNKYKVKNNLSEI